jgi:hypothetical protein
MVQFRGARDAGAHTRILAHAKAPGLADQASRRSRCALGASIPYLSFLEQEELVRVIVR